MGWLDQLLARMGRRRNEPKRDTSIYPRIFNIGSQTVNRSRPMVKPTPANIRRFGKTVYARRAINTVKNPIATLKWEIAPKSGVKANPEIARQVEVLTNCFDHPNHDDSFRSLVEQIIEDLMHCGAGALEHQVGGDQLRPLWMWPTDALSIQIDASWDGDPAKARYFQSVGYGNVGGQLGVPLRNDELIYMRLDPTTENPFGLGPLEVAFNSINRQLGAADYAGNVSSNAQPENLLFFQDADEETIQSVRGFWRNEVEGQGSTPIFGGAGEPKAIRIRGATDDALYLKWQEFLIREIAAAFGISPQNLSIERDVNRDTAEVAEDRDWRLTIIPLADLVASYLNREVVEGQLGFSQVEFKWVGLDRDDEKAAADIYRLRYEGNAITPAEERERLGLPPMKSPWANLTYADVQIAIKAAQGAKVVEDDELPAGGKTNRNSDRSGGKEGQTDGP